MGKSAVCSWIGSSSHSKWHMLLCLSLCYNTYHFQSSEGFKTFIDPSDILVGQAVKTVTHILQMGKIEF